MKVRVDELRVVLADEVRTDLIRRQAAQPCGNRGSRALRRG
jgi:hypothetical protein